MKTKDLTHVALFAALLAICSWISIPSSVPFTLQTLGVFMAVGLLGKKRGTLAVIVFLLLGLFGLPVFSGFKGGVGVLFGPTGGYLIGFIGTAYIMGSILERYGRSTASMLIAMVIGLLICYAFGTAWFMIVYGKAQGSISLLATLSMCVFPFIIPDILKIIVSHLLIQKLYPLLSRQS